MSSTVIPSSSNSIETDSVCPSTTPTLLQEALNGKFALSTSPPLTLPSKCNVSDCIFSSSPPMKGMMLSNIPIDGTPLYPAPLTACIVVTETLLKVYLSNNGFKVNVKAIVEQLGFVTIHPSQPFTSFCVSIISRCSGLTSGITRGIFSFIRLTLAFEATINFSAKAASTGSARPAGNEANTKSTSSLTSEGSVLTILMSLTSSGIGVV